jgi:hypothetical protein
MAGVCVCGRGCCALPCPQTIICPTRTRAAPCSPRHSEWWHAVERRSHGGSSPLCVRRRLWIAQRRRDMTRRPAPLGTPFSDKRRKITHLGCPSCPLPYSAIVLLSLAVRRGGHALGGFPSFLLRGPRVGPRDGEGVEVAGGGTHAGLRIAANRTRSPLRAGRGGGGRGGGAAGGGGGRRGEWVQERARGGGAAGGEGASASVQIGDRCEGSRARRVKSSQVKRCTKK